MDESTKTVSYATADNSLAVVVERINAKLAELAATGIPVAPEHVRYGGIMNEHGPRYLGSFSYLVNSEVPA